MTRDLVRQILADMTTAQASDHAEPHRQRLLAARQVLEETCLVDDWPQFFTGYAYAQFLASA